MSEGKESRTKLFFRLFMANEGRIYTYILMLVPHRAEADDIMQETAMVMWKRFADFEAGTNFLRWSKQIAFYKILDFRKKRSKERIYFNENLLGALAEHVDTTLAEANPRLIALKNCLEKLDKSDRKLIYLHYEQGVTIKKIAQDLKRSIQGMYKVMTRIHNQLLRCINHKLASEDFRELLG